MKLFLRADPNNVTWNKKLYLLAAAKRLGFDWVTDINDRQGDEPTDYILNIEPCGEVLGGNIWTGLWHIDVIFNNSYHQQYGGCDDIFIATTPDNCNSPCPKGKLLFQACDPVLHRRIAEIPQDYDFVLCGSMGSGVYQAREDAINILKKHFTYKDFGKNHPPEVYVQNYNHAKVQFIRGALGPTLKSNAAQRFFECIAIGATLTNWTPDLIHTGLKEGEDYLSYKTPREMVAKMRRLLKDENYRDWIAQNSRTKALLYHTYEHRLMSIINSIKEHDNLFSPA